MSTVKDVQMNHLVTEAVTRKIIQDPDLINEIFDEVMISLRWLHKWELWIIIMLLTLYWKANIKLHSQGFVDVDNPF